MLRDGDPGEPEHALGGFRGTYYQHAVEIEVDIEEGECGGTGGGTPTSLTFSRISQFQARSSAPAHRSRI